MAAPFTCPEHIAVELKAHDRRLSVEWNPVEGGYEIVYLRTGFPKPDKVFHKITGQRHPYFAMIRRVERSDGSPRKPDQRDVKWIRAADTQNQRPKDVIRECIESKDKWDKDRTDAMLEQGRETFGDVAYRWAVKRDQVGFGG